ncbi:hypothetical protein [Chitinophaga barathri]|uniref:Uncharacterized protein n=1 Tax=Chitinophaga barathri TaxID=1647451 RepID=A0A3N4MFR7_9BACT|nr:hypothetical protein [Chitinophaga barathri]RPD42448.1 hypothetical protein EG028_04535 [Chitinophaga barathri]
MADIYLQGTLLVVKVKASPPTAVLTGIDVYEEPAEAADLIAEWLERVPGFAGRIAEEGGAMERKVIEYRRGTEVGSE